jgi:hypothetical protein
MFLLHDRSARPVADRNTTLVTRGGENACTGAA